MAGISLADLTVDEKRAFLKDLLAARFSGAKRVRFRERDVTYRTDAELKAVIDDLSKDILGATRRRTSVTSFASGL